MREYELMFILDVSLAEDDRRKIVNDVERELIDLDAEIKDSTQYDVRDLAYQIKDVTRGDYRLISFYFEPTRCQELQERLNFRDDILRYLLVNMEERTTPEDVEEAEEKAEEPAEEEVNA